MIHDGFPTRSQAMVVALAGSFLAYSTVPAVAGCSTGTTTVTCSGDLSDGLDLDVSGITDVVIQDLTADAGALVFSQTGTDSTDEGGAGSDATTLELSFDGSSEYGAENSDGTVLDINLAGGGGGPGHKSVTGGTGGVGGSVSFSFDNVTEIAGESGFALQSTAGNGGDGEERSEGNPDNDIEAPDGGAGGAGGTLSIEVDGGVKEFEATSGL